MVYLKKLGGIFMIDDLYHSMQKMQNVIYNKNTAYQIRISKSNLSETEFIDTVKSVIENCLKLKNKTLYLTIYIKKRDTHSLTGIIVISRETLLVEPKIEQLTQYEAYNITLN